MNHPCIWPSFSLKSYVVEIHGEHYDSTFSTRHRFVLTFVLRSSERVLKESSSPGVEVLVFSLVFGIREISTGSSPAVEPDER